MILDQEHKTVLYVCIVGFPEYHTHSGNYKTKLFGSP